LYKKDGYYFGDCVSKKSPPLKPQIINLYWGKRDGYYLGETVFKKSPPIYKKIGPDKRGHVKIN
jgi:hypothetical protein